VLVGVSDAQAGTSDQLLKRAVDPGQPLTLSQLAGLWPCYDNNVVAALKRRLDTVERFAKQALDMVALDSSANLSRHRQSKSRTVDGLIGKRVKHQVTVGHRAALTVYTLELRTAREASTAAM
jgi:hypothetical protein